MLARSTSRTRDSRPFSSLESLARESRGSSTIETTFLGVDRRASLVGAILASAQSGRARERALSSGTFLDGSHLSRRLDYYCATTRFDLSPIPPRCGRTRRRRGGTFFIGGVFFPKRRRESRTAWLVDSARKRQVVLQIYGLIVACLPQTLSSRRSLVTRIVDHVRPLVTCLPFDQALESVAPSLWDASTVIRFVRHTSISLHRVSLSHLRLTNTLLIATFLVPRRKQQASVPFVPILSRADKPRVQKRS